jgi:transglutaminase-like putative cysteine protease
VLIGVAGVLSVSLDLGLYLGVWAVAALVSLVLAYRSELSTLPALVGAGEDDTGTGAGKVRRAGARFTARRTVPVVALVLLIGLGVLLLAPQAGPGTTISFPARLPSRETVPNPGGLSNPALGRDNPSGGGDEDGNRSKGRASFGYFGFAKSMDTSLRGRPDRTLVMRVRAGRPDFWRGQTFDTWDGRTWVQSDEDVDVVQGDQPIEIPGTLEERALGIRDRGGDFVHTVYVEKPGPNLIFAAYAPAEVYVADPALFQLSDGTLRTAVELEQGAIYTVVSRRPAVTEDILRFLDAPPLAGLPPSAVRRYTQLPADVPDRVERLAADVTATAPTTYDKVRALEAWMGENTQYTLDIPPLPAGADAVEHYLFEEKRGFCEQIASSLVVMLRSLGIPSRLAVGYTPGERNPFTGLYEVRADDAHAWAEVWFPGVGWQAFDPTAKVPFAGDPFSSRAGEGLFRFVAGRVPDLPANAAEVAGVLAAIAVITFGSWGFVRDRVERQRAAARRTWAEVVLARLEATGAKRGRARRPNETAREYATALRTSVLPDDRLSELGTIVEADAFSGGAVDEARRRRAEELLHELESSGRK